jgi:hypothetical protein
VQEEAFGLAADENFGGLGEVLELCSVGITGMSEVSRIWAMDMVQDATNRKQKVLSRALGEGLMARLIVSPSREAESKTIQSPSARSRVPFIRQCCWKMKTLTRVYLLEDRRWRVRIWRPSRSSCS